MSCVMCESDGVQLRPAVDMLVVPYSGRLGMDCVQMSISKLYSH